jgi:hypothetical protein
VGKTAYPGAGKMTLRRQQILEFGLQGHLIRLGGTVNVRRESRKGAAIGYLLAHAVDVDLLFPQAFKVILLGLDLHFHSNLSA